MDKEKFPRLNDEQFPVLFENDKIRVFKNPSDEIFVETKDFEHSVQMRVSTQRHSLLVTAGNGNGIMTPSSINGLPAFVVRQP